MKLLLESNNQYSTECVSARSVIETIAKDIADARDNLMLAKISQAYHANTKRKEDTIYKHGDLVMLSTMNRRCDYKCTREQRVAKFMPRFDGPYLVTDVNLKASTVSLDIPQTPNLFPTFHTAHIKCFIPNNDSKFPMRTLEKPGPIQVDGIG